MWYERFAIIAVSLHRDFLPSSWGMYYPTWVDVFTFVGTIGLFLTLFLLFIRFFPMVAMSEVKSVLPEADPHYSILRIYRFFWCFHYEPASEIASSVV
jgi:Ni/Fe-hydrogenase subunit HybB-like protein